MERTGISLRCVIGSAKEFEVDLSFLTEGEYEVVIMEYEVVIMEDGPNARKMAQDYTKKSVSLSKGDTLKSPKLSAKK